ncbi:MAG: HD domain-containing protein [Ruminiclostridium sp.]
MNKLTVLAKAMIDYYRNDPKRINHFIKVHAFAKEIGELENLSEETLFILETAAYVHDIGIKNSELKYGSSAGKYQEIEGPAEAEKLLSQLGFDKRVINRVSYLVGHHHTYDKVDGEDYRILIEADFIVNAYEDCMSKESIENVRSKIFRTKSGTEILDTLFPCAEE